jgi:hypothetical protein
MTVYKTDNYPNEIGSCSAVKNAYLKFDLGGIPTDDTVLNATLFLYVVPWANYTQPFPTGVVRTASTWTDVFMCPTTTAAPIGSVLDVVDCQDNCSLDVTLAAVDCVEDGNKTLALSLYNERTCGTNGTSQYQVFYSAYANQVYVPTLVVETVGSTWITTQAVTTAGFTTKAVSTQAVTTKRSNSHRMSDRRKVVG